MLLKLASSGLDVSDVDGSRETVT